MSYGISRIYSNCATFFKDNMILLAFGMNVTGHASILALVWAGEVATCHVLIGKRVVTSAVNRNFSISRTVQCVPKVKPSCSFLKHSRNI